MGDNEHCYELPENVKVTYEMGVEDALNFIVDMSDLIERLPAVSMPTLTDIERLDYMAFLAQNINHVARALYSGIHVHKKD